MATAILSHIMPFCSSACLFREQAYQYTSIPCPVTVNLDMTVLGRWCLPGFSL